MLTPKMYQPLDGSVLTSKEIEIIKKTTLTIKNNSLFHYQSDHYSTDKLITMPIGTLVRSLNYEKFDQFDINADNVKRILFKNDNSLIKTEKLIEPIVIAALNQDYQEAIKLDKNPAFTIVSGHHRLVALLTWAYYSDIRMEGFNQVQLRVSFKIAESVEELAELSNSCKRISKNDIYRNQQS